jgi:hypothetical protein
MLLYVHHINSTEGQSIRFHIEMENHGLDAFIFQLCSDWKRCLFHSSHCRLFPPQRFPFDFKLANAAFDLTQVRRGWSECGDGMINYDNSRQAAKASSSKA